jgi:hypothetical protein
MHVILEQECMSFWSRNACHSYDPREVTNSHQRHPDPIYHLDLKPRQHIHGCKNPLVGATATRQNVLTAANTLAGVFNFAANQLTQVVRPQ